MKCFKRILNLLFSCCLIVNIVCADYMVANATEVLVPTLSILDSFLISFGVSVGLGYQMPSNRMRNDFDAMMRGGTVEVAGYGTVNWSDNDSIKAYADYCSQFTSVPEFDYISYKNTGTASSKALIENVKNYITDGSSALAEDVRDCFQVITGGGGSPDPGNNNDDDKEPSDMPDNWWNTCCAFASTLFLGLSGEDIFNEFSVPDNSQFNDYFINVDINDHKTIVSSGFSGIYSYYSDPKDTQLSLYKDYKIIGTGSYSNYINTYISLNTNNLYSIFFNDRYYFYEYSSALDSYRNYNIIYVSKSPYSIYHFDQDYTQNFDVTNSIFCPLFADHDSAKRYFVNGDLSGIINIDSDYENFKKNVPNPHADLAEPLSRIQPAHLPKLAPMLETAPVGVPESIPSTIDLIKTVVPQPVPDPEPAPDPEPVPVPEPDPEPDDPDPDDPDNKKPKPEPSASSVPFINGILALLGILLMLLKIFLHLLEFIINIFRIPADPGFITGDFKTGFEYIKTVQLSPLNMSIYDFLMGLVHITIFFGVVKLLRQKIDNLHF